MQLGAGANFAGHTIERKLGAGGMGVVYLARHPRLNRSVALKVLTESKAGDAGVRSRFEREIELITALDHPNIVPVYDRGAEGDTLWVSMKYIAGGDVSSLLDREGPLDPTRAVRLLTDAAAGLQHAHAHGIVHRDVKPANLLLESDGAHERALVADFGIARTSDATITASGFLASFAYTAPERFSGDIADHRSDIYSLGCTLFQMLTGRTPFPARDQAAIMAAHLTAPPPRPSTLRPTLPAGLDAVIAKSLAKRPQDRYPNCAAMAEDALRALTTTQPGAFVRPPVPMPPRPTWAQLPPAPPRQERPHPLRRWGIAAAAAGLAGVVSLTTFLLVRESGNHATTALSATPATSSAPDTRPSSTPPPSTSATTTTTALPAQVVTTPTVVAKCEGTPEIRPVTISALHCGTNADIWIDGLSWTKWDQDSAVGTGTVHLNSCQPSCSAGNYKLDPVTVTLDKVDPFGNTYMRITLSGADSETDNLPTG
ncbi:serine/threonine-protein kinase [Nocardia sp. NPDC020380]|uniref:serine/threonine-protein kinase n=1 Tax=Nocardia sp. NPDC020380 TaxID=3364309 RepID=UPI0037BBCC84